MTSVRAQLHPQSPTGISSVEGWAEHSYDEMSLRLQDAERAMHTQTMFKSLPKIHGSSRSQSVEPMRARQVMRPRSLPMLPEPEPEPEPELEPQPQPEPQPDPRPQSVELRPQPAQGHAPAARSTAKRRTRDSERVAPTAARDRASGGQKTAELRRIAELERKLLEKDHELHAMGAELRASGADFDRSMSQLDVVQRDLFSAVESEKRKRVAAEAEVQRLRQCLEIFAVQSAQQSQFALAQAGLLTTDASTANSQIQDLLEPAKPEVCD